MAFESFKSRSQFNGIRIIRGSFSISRAFYKELGESKHIEVQIDVENSLVGIIPLPEATEGSYQAKVYHSSPKVGANISSRLLLGRYIYWKKEGDMFICKKL